MLVSGSQHDRQLYTLGNANNDTCGYHLLPYKLTVLIIFPMILLKISGISDDGCTT